MDVREIDEILYNSVVRVDGEEYGTGFYIDDNLILTAYHVIKADEVKGNNIRIIHDVKGQNITTASVISYNEKLDVALLRTNSNIKMKLPLEIRIISEDEKWRAYTCLNPLDGTQNYFEKSMIKGEIYQVESFGEFNYDIHLSGIYLDEQPYNGGFGGCSGTPVIIDGSIVAIIVKQELSQRKTPLKAISFLKLKDYFTENGISFQNEKKEAEKDISFNNIFKKVIPESMMLEYSTLPSINLLYDQYNNPTSIVMPPNIASRTTLVKDIVHKLKDNDVLNIYGLVCSGKSILAGLIVNEIDKYQLYIDLSGVNINNMIRIINDIMKSILESKNVYDNKEEIMEQICKIININGVMILDNFPLIKKGDKLYYFINSLLLTCKKYGMKVIIISTKNIKHLRYQSSTIKIDYEESSHLLKEDLCEMLDKYNLKYNDSHVTFLYNITGGDASLVYSLLYYLRNNSWSISDKFPEILSGGYANEMRDDLQYKIMDFIDDKEVKELLYRISLLDSPYSEEYVEVVAQVNPPITFVAEKLNLLEGWILKHGDLYSNSLLLQQIAVKNLKPDTVIEIHKKIADKILKDNKCLDYIMFIRVFTHLNEAKEYNRAGLLLVNALDELYELDVDQDYWNVLSFWRELDPPSSMDISIVLYLRVLQIKCCDKFNIDCKDLFYKLDDCIRRIIDKNKQEYLVTLTLLSLRFSTSKPAIALKYLEIIFQNIDSSTMESMTSDFEGIKVEHILYICCVSIKRFEEIKLFLKVYDILSVKQLENLNTVEKPYEFALALCSNLYLEEKKKPDLSRNWYKVLEYLSMISDSAERTNNKWLLVSSVKIKIIILGECLKDLPKAESMALKILKSKYGTDKEVEFIVKEAIGSQYVVNKDYEKAKEYFDGIKVEFEDLYFEKIDYFKKSSIINSKYDKLKAIENLKDASKIIEMANLPYTEKIKNLGELMIEYWNNNAYINMYALIKNVLDIMNSINLNDKGDQWKSLFMCLGHCTGYFGSFLSSGKGPGKTAEGDEYHKPIRGLFDNDDGNKAFLFSEQKMLLIYLQISIIAEYLGEYSDCKSYIRKFINEYKFDTKILAIAQRKLVSYVISNNFEEAYNLTIEFAKNLYSSDEEIELEEYVAKFLFNDMVIPAMFVIIRKYIDGDLDYKNDSFKLIKLLEKQSYICTNDFLLIKNLINYNILSDGERAVRLEIQQNHKYHDYLLVIQYISLFKWGRSYGLSDIARIQNAIVDYLIARYNSEPFLFNQVIKDTFLKFWTVVYCENRTEFSGTSIIDEQLKKWIDNKKNMELKDLIQLMSTSIG